MLPTTTDVLVIGAGPPGLSVALSLTSRGRPVTIVDQQAERPHSTGREQARVGIKAGGAGESYSLGDVHLSGGAPTARSPLYCSPEGQLVSVPCPDGSYKVVANVPEASHEPDVTFIQQLI